MRILEWKKNKKKHYVLLNVGVESKNNFAKSLYNLRICLVYCTNVGSNDSYFSSFTNNIMLCEKVLIILFMKSLENL